jgi:hypothetical protein
LVLHNLQDQEALSSLTTIVKIWSEFEDTWDTSFRGILYRVLRRFRGSVIRGVIKGIKAFIPRDRLRDLAFIYYIYN